MAVAVAGLAVREVPVASLTLITLPSVGLRMAITLTGYEITFVVLRTDAVAITSLTSVRRESISARCAFVALSADDVGFALAMTSMLFTLLAERSRRVAVTS